jgi:FdhD protein
MVKKNANAGIPVVISRAASTDKGIATADAAGITLICFSRGDRFTVYTHPGRIAGLSGV